MQDGLHQHRRVGVFLCFKRSESERDDLGAVDGRTRQGAAGLLVGVRFHSAVSATLSDAADHQAASHPDVTDLLRKQLNSSALKNLSGPRPCQGVWMCLTLPQIVFPLHACRPHCLCPTGGCLMLCEESISGLWPIPSRTLPSPAQLRIPIICCLLLSCLPP